MSQTNEEKKKLMRGPQSFNDWLSLIIVVLAIFAAWAYQRDTAIRDSVIESCTKQLIECKDLCGIYEEKEGRVGIEGRFFIGGENSYSNDSP